MVSKELVRELIGDYSADRFVRVLKMACAPASFMSVGKEYRFRDVSDEPIQVLGVVGNLPGENGLLAPLLVADVPLATVLTERSSRIRQFKLAKKVLEHFAATPPMDLGGSVIAQGVFVFHDADGRFRVSLVTATPENGKFNWSKARRQSFYVTNDPDANATFVQRMCMNWGTLKGIKEAFSVEKLTKEFYNQLFAWYERVCDDERVEYPNGLDTDADNREDKNRKHIIRLITRLMFVWFLKQKKLVPDSLFDEAELKRILKNFNPVGRKQHQYYRAILQNLFFATLNSEVEERGFAESPNPRPSDGKVMSRHHGVKTKYRYADEFAISRQKILDLFRPIPFLNGGLFECLDQENADGKVMYYDGFSLQERHRDLGTLTWAHVPNDLFFDPDYGIIPLLRRYNFTVEENSPGDEDVALDPELLGKVFENLLGAFNPETQEIARNTTGSFYTPREIVNYMVDESLIAYLTTATSGGRGATALPNDGRAGSPLPAVEKAIRSLVTDGVRPTDDALCKRLAQSIEKAKILDPACGSGAFPMGALLKMVELLRVLKKLPEGGNLYDLKLKLIENCIFGSDIQEIAVQISKLRIFISLVCEQKPDMSKPNYGINPLPNLETKFVAANSLIALKKEEKGKKVQGDLFYDLDEIRQTKKELWEVRHRHFTAQTRRAKNELRQKDKVLRGKLAATAKRFGYSEESTCLMASWDPYNQNVHAEFFDPEWMFNVKDGFDVVIGNPPYVKVTSDDLLVGYYKEHYKSGSCGRTNLYKIFVERGMLLLKQGGGFAYIIPNSYLADNSVLLRDFLLKRELVEIIEYTEKDKVFENVAQAVTTLVLKNETPSNNHRCHIVTAKQGSAIIAQSDFMANDGHRFVPVSSLIAKMRLQTHSLNEWFEIFQGEVNLTTKSGFFGEKERSNSLPMWRGDNVGKFIAASFPVEFCDKEATQREHWRHERIVMKQVTNQQSQFRTAAFITPKAYFCGNSTNYLLPRNNGVPLKVFLGLLNSKAFNYLFSYFSFTNHITTAELCGVKIPGLTDLRDSDIITVVDRILAAKKRNPEADTSALEREIDEKVYRLYGLTDDEIRVIEGTNGGEDVNGQDARPSRGGTNGRDVRPSGGKKKRKPKIEEEF